MDGVCVSGDSIFFSSLYSRKKSIKKIFSAFLHKYLSAFIFQWWRETPEIIWTKTRQILTVMESPTQNILSFFELWPSLFTNTPFLIHCMALHRVPASSGKALSTMNIHAEFSVLAVQLQAQTYFTKCLYIILRLVSFLNC